MMLCQLSADWPEKTVGHHLAAAHFSNALISPCFSVQMLALHRQVQDAFSHLHLSPSYHRPLVLVE